jgi:3-phosphoglycerate kinase
MTALLPRVDSLAVIAPDLPGEAGGGVWRGSDPGSSAYILESVKSVYPDKLIEVGLGDASNEKRAKSLALLSRRLDKARTILWSGPAGLASLKKGAREESKACLAVHALALHRAARRGAVIVVCSEEEKQLGGQAFGTQRAQGLHISTGPRAFLEYLERLSLPGITALDPAEE